MSIRRKTRNRILVLLSLAVVGTGALGGAYLVRRSYLNAAALRDRDAGMAAVKAEDYAKGLEDLGHYLGRFSNRPEADKAPYAEALFNFALSRQMVEEPKRGHLVTAVSLWKRYLALPAAVRTREAEARRKLLDAQVGLGWLPEALDTAVSILDENKSKGEPGDLKSLAIQTQVLQLQRKYSAALIAAQAWAQAYPHDLDAHQMVVQLTGQLEPEKATNKYFVDYAEGLLKTDPKEPHYALLASFATDQGLDLQDKPAARAKLAHAAALALSAAAGDLSEAQLVKGLVRQLDMLWVQSILLGSTQEVGVSGKGLDLARRSLAAHPADLEYQRLYALELLQVNGSKEVETFLNATTPQAAKADGRLLALKAFAAFNQGDHKADGQALLEAAEKAGNKEAGVAALCEALRAVFVTASADAAAVADLQKALSGSTATVADCQAKLRAFVQNHPDDTQPFAELKATLDDKAADITIMRTKLDAYRLARLQALQEICKAAAAKSPSDPLVAYLLGEVGLRAGDAQGAAEALKQTLALAPIWVQANLRMGQLALAAGNGQVAAQYADIVHGLAPDDPNMLIFETLVSARVAAPGQTEQINKALGFLQELQKRFPDKVSPADKQLIAQQLSRLGRDQEAIAFLKATLPVATAPTATAPGYDTLMLAKLYANQNRFGEAQNLIDQLLSGTPTLDVIMFAADLAASRPDLSAQEKKDQVDRAMARLDALKPPLPAGVKDRVWADYYSRHGMPQQAIDSWKDALKADPNPAIWQMLLAFCLKNTDTEQFNATASFFTNLAEVSQALKSKKIQDNPAISHLIPLQETLGRKGELRTPTLLEEMCQDLFMRSMIVALLETPDGHDERTESYAKAIAASVDALAESQKDVDKLTAGDAAGIRAIQDKLIPVLQKLVDDNPTVLPIQNLLVGIFGIAEHYDQCVAMATRTMRTFPDNPAAPAQTAIRVLGAAGRWEEALAVAKEWRQRSLAQPMAADLAIADAYLNLRRPSDAIAQLTDPYLNEIKNKTKSPNDYEQVYARYLQALLNSGETGAAVTTITPLLSERRWRILWMQSMVLVPDEKFAATSLVSLEADIPPDAKDERAALAQALKAVADRVNMSSAMKASCLKSAAALLEPLALPSGSNPSLQTLLALIYEDQKEFSSAAGIYRQQLKVSPENVVAMNNLASNLANMKKPEDAPEAIRLMALAIKLQPKVPNFYDTQASVYALLSQDYPNALKSIQQAITLEPTNPNWRVSRIWILANSGQKPTAMAEFAELKKTMVLSQLFSDSRQKLNEAGLQ